MKEPELVSATQDELDELTTLAKTSFPDKQYELLAGVLCTFVIVMLRLQNAKSSIKKLQRMIFGARTGHERNVPGDTAAGADGAAPHAVPHAVPHAAQAGDATALDGAPERA